VFQNVEAALEAAATGLGIGADHVNEVLDSLSIDMTKVSLKGLSGQALTDAISTVISKATDDMAAAVFPELDSFRKVGEGYAQTVIRLATEYGQLDVALASIGKQFGAVGVQSLAARQNLIEMVGGIDKFVEQTSSFAENYLTEAERLAPVQKYVTEQMAGMGLATVTTKDQFKALVQGLDLSTAAGAKQYASLMAVADAFAAVTDAADDLAEKRGDLEGQIYDLTHTATEVTARQRQVELAAMDASLRPLQERIYALTDEKAASALAAEAIKKAQEQAAAYRAAELHAYSDFGNALSDVIKKAREAAKELRDYSTTLLVGEDSPLSDKERMSLARAQFDAAKGSELKDASAAYLAALKEIGATGLDYAKGFAAVQSRLLAAAAAEDRRADGAQDWLKWLASSRSMGGVDGSHASGLDSVPFDGYRAELHRNEKVLTSAEASDYRGGAKAIEKNNALIERLISAVETGNRAGQTVADTLRRVTRDGNTLITESP